MKSKSALFALAVFVLMGSMAVAASADDQRLNLYASADSAYWPASDHQFDNPEAAPSEAAEIREPMETGAVPELSESSTDMHSGRPGDEEAAGTVEFGGLKYRSIDLP